jgi:hypothetical protein
MNDKIKEAESLFKTAEPTRAMTEYQREQLALHANRERLKAERLAREARPDGQAVAFRPCAGGGDESADGGCGVIDAIDSGTTSRRRKSVYSGHFCGWADG